MKVIFAIAEAAPFVKTGGLGEVGGSLPLALKKQGIDVGVILPKYSSIPDHFQKQMLPITSFQVPLSWRRQYCGLEVLEHNGIPYYFLDNEYYFNRKTIFEEFDSAEQFAFFSRAVLESLQHIPACRTDILHCNDWHTALAPLMIKELYERNPCHYEVKTVFTIHNLKYQGIFGKEILSDILGLDPSFNAPEKLGFHGGINFMKAALLYADRLTTVSPTYASEILTSFYGEKLDDLLQQRSDKLSGIVNGLDYSVYDPNHDPLIKFSFDSSPLAKLNNKKYLQSLLGLPISNSVPVLSLVSRLVDQKGLDLLTHVLDEILALDLQLVIQGTGEEKFEKTLRYFAQKYPQKMAFRNYFSEELAHQIYSGSDIFLMPSQFEPCGTSQMIAMRYGTLPIVRATGGLVDTVISYEQNPERGNGFLFSDYNAHEFLFAIQRVVRLFTEEQSTWGRIIANAMNTNFSWDQSAEEYVKLYKSLSRMQVK